MRLFPIIMIFATSACAVGFALLALLLVRVRGRIGGKESASPEKLRRRCGLTAVLSALYSLCMLIFAVMHIIKVDGAIVSSAMVAFTVIVLAASLLLRRVLLPWREIKYLLSQKNIHGIDY